MPWHNVTNLSYKIPQIDVIFDNYMIINSLFFLGIFHLGIILKFSIGWFCGIYNHITPDFGILWIKLNLFKFSFGR